MGFQKGWTVLLPNLIPPTQKGIMIIMQFTDKQLEQLKPNAVENYISELVAYCDKNFPYLKNVMGEQNLREILALSIDKAKESGFTQRGPVQFYINMQIVLGAGFETDPQYPWIYKNLERNNNLPQLERTDRLYLQTKEYLDKIVGEQEKYLFDCANRLQHLTLDNMKVGRRDYIGDVHLMLHDMYPQKYQETEKDTLTALIRTGTEKAYHDYGFEQANHSAMIVLLMFIKGHKFDQDPFCPWANRDKLIKYKGSSNVLAERLEKRAKVWLDAAIKNNPIQRQG
ncbi:hypothetical protein [Gilliamella apis]|uniref:Uncharacterized protein n=1 Tax=Gilliamella apis TaxID=1970738 RepID=A0A242NXY3_9GAMM|nr:hypothetical protein [Gilliamella apis]OTQ53733.1 hypothetical protein B6D06_00625 [Gilliamella apis]